MPKLILSLLVIGSTVVRNVGSETPDNTTLVLNWLPPDPTNGDILNYTVRVTLNASNDVTIVEENVTATSFTATNLSKLCHGSKK